MAADPRLRQFDATVRGRAAAVLGSLRSFFLVMPRGSSFCERDDFQAGFDSFRRATNNGQVLEGDAFLTAILVDPRAWLVLRCILGVSPGEAAYLASEVASARGQTVQLDQTLMRTIDTRAKRDEPLLFTASTRKSDQECDAAVRELAPLLADVLKTPLAPVSAEQIHRLDKFDTDRGHASVIDAFKNDLYCELLYERLLGRPYASHRDSVSGKVGDLIEDEIASLLARYGIDGTMARAREHVPGFEQAPDCRVPSQSPKVIIEAKLTEDDGTARDKVARVQTLRGYEDMKPPEQRCQIVAVIDGRGFGVRMADLDRLLKATDGQVYTLTELELLVAPGGPLAPFVTKRP